MDFRALLLALLCFAASCSTTGHFVLPPGAQLEVNGSVLDVDSEGTAETWPFFWNTTGGVKYRLLENGQPVKEGKLQTAFRVVSIFWPPYAILYWPMGLKGDLVYDLVHDKQEPR